MSRVERIRRSLGLPVEPPTAPPPLTVRRTRDTMQRPRGDRIAALRREISRIEGSWSGPAPRAPGHPAQIVAGRTSDAVNEAELPPGFYRETYHAARHHFGRYPVSRPDQLATTLERLERLLPLIGEAEDGKGHLPPLGPDDLLFVDTETTGLSRAAGTIAFLVGVGRFDGSGQTYEVDQLLLREPAEEPEMLARLQPYFERARVIVSFNGRGFDLPILRNRSILSRTALSLDRPHLDLLPLGRRVFGGRTSNCRLGTLEREVLGFVRGDDVDGSEVPTLYLDYLRTGQASLLDGVIEHNRLDVATMAPLFALTVDHLLDPLHWAEDAEELLSVGQLHQRWGNAELAESCLRRGIEIATLPATRARLLVELAALRRRQGDRSAASLLWQQYADEFPGHNAGWVELAKHHEHATKDLARALAYAEQAPHGHRDEVLHRIGRLKRRLRRALEQ